MPGTGAATEPSRRTGLLLGVGGMVVLSTDSLFARAADADRFDIVFWVGLCTAAVTSVIGAVRHRAGPVALVRRGGRPLLLAAALQATTLTCFVVAVRTTAVANVVAILAAAPLAAAVLARVLIGERSTRRVWTAAAVSGVGVLVVVGGSLGAGDVRGDLLAVGAIVAFGSGAVVLRRHPELDRTTVVGLGGALMALVASPAATTSHDVGTWAALVAMGAVVGPTARVMLAAATRHLTVAEVGLFAPLETVLATVWAWLAFDEVPAAATWVGAAVVLAALVGANVPLRRAAR
ncbi:DMT family transporter [Actinomarinicola tropica]|uniref:EamA family transporter n=1 Tax=Actinomarinicola tropica TaxID=2789776 RepID=A0A5Q2RPJ9_9ACTN|nr:DMT family transporter [Actinomarinicola tropica]QGG95800.1 EamA family transporter [Actinomarinicola tropica]